MSGCGKKCGARRRMGLTAVPAVGAILPLLLSACAIIPFHEGAGWVASGPFSDGCDRVWDAVHAELRISPSWAIDEEDKEDGVINTDWLVENYLNEVSRRKVEVRILHTAEGYIVKLRIPHERVFPSFEYDVGNPEGADWDWVGYDEEMTDTLARGIRMRLHPTGEAGEQLTR